MKRQNYGEFIIDVVKTDETLEILNKKEFIDLLNKSKYYGTNNLISKKLILHLNDELEGYMHVISNHMITDEDFINFDYIEMSQIATSFLKGINVRFEPVTDENSIITDLDCYLEYINRPFTPAE